MAQISAADLYGMLRAEGLDPQHAAAFTMIAERESGFRPDAFNGNLDTGDNSHGLFQINLLHTDSWGGWAPFLREKLDWSGTDEEIGERLQTPQGSVEAVGAIFRNSGMNPWGGYKEKAWNFNTNPNTAIEASGGEITLDDLLAMDGFDLGQSELGDPGGLDGDSLAELEAELNATSQSVDTAPIPAPDARTTDPRAPLSHDVHSPDTDLDGLTDAYELAHGLDATSIDSDFDGLSDIMEELSGNPGAAQSADQDHDGLLDSFEIGIGLDPTKADSDGDGLVDSEGMAALSGVDADVDGLDDALEALFGTDTTKADTDGDGFTDGIEHELGRDPMVAELLDPVGGPDPTAPTATPTGVVATLPDGTQVTLDATTLTPLAAPAAPAAPIGVAAIGGVDAGRQPMVDVSSMVAGDEVDREIAESPVAVNATAEEFLRHALDQDGDRYVMNQGVEKDNEDPDVFDCSGLVQWSAHQAGVEVPRSSFEQYLYFKERGQLISVEEAKEIPGALLFSFSTEPVPGGGRPSSAHVAISTGDGGTIEAKGSDYGVLKSDTGDRFEFAALPAEFAAGPDDVAAHPEFADRFAPAPPVAAPIDVPPPDPNSPDSDHDGLTDAFEALHNLDANSADSDHDGISDIVELTETRTDAASADSDHDGLMDSFEIGAGLDPLAADSDGDGFVDSVGLIAESGIDADADGLDDAIEGLIGTRADLADTDGDGFTDAIEYELGSDALGLTDLPGDHDVPVGLDLVDNDL